MAEEIDLEKCNFWNFRSPVTLTLDRVIRHTVVHQSSTSVYIPNFIEIRKTFLCAELPQGRVEVQGHVTQKLGQISKIWPTQFRYCALL